MSTPATPSAPSPASSEPVAAPPPPSSSPRPPLPKAAPPPSANTAKPANAPKTRRRKPLKRRGARAHSDESEEDGTAPNRDYASDTDSDFAPSLHADDDDEDDDDDSEGDTSGAGEPKTPATASVEQLAPKTGGKVKAVLEGQELHPSWSDMPADGEDGANQLPTLDFANLSLAAVAALPAEGARKGPAKHLVLGADGKPLSKKQLVQQRREAKDQALKDKDPAAFEALEKERSDKAEAKRAAKKAKDKERRKEKKALEKAARTGVVPAAAAAPAPPAASTSAAAPAPTHKPSAPVKPSRPVVPSRPSRTGLALGLVNPASAPADHQPVAPSGPAALTRPVVPAFQRTPAFIRPGPGAPTGSGSAESWRGRGGARGGFAPRGGRGRGAASRFTSDRWVAQGEAIDDVVRGVGKQGGEGADEDDKWGRGEAKRTPRPSAVDALPNWSHAGFEELEAEEQARAAVGAGTGRGRGRGRGRGGVPPTGPSTWGGLSTRGGTLNGPPGAINPRYAHLPFHPLHRFPGPLPAASSAPASSSAAPAPSAADAAAPAPAADSQPVSQPEATTAASEQELFDAGEAEAKKPVGVVRLPSAGAAQFALAIKGAVAARAKEEAEQPRPVAAVEQKENEPIRPVPTRDDADLALRKQQGASILYAADPSRFANVAAEEPVVSAPLLPSYEQHPQEHSLPPHMSASAFMHQVTPHLQSPPAVQAPFIPRHSSPAYYPPAAPQPYYSPDAFSTFGVPTPDATPPPLFPPHAAHAPPSSAYFLPPRPNKRVEIKAPSRDGQSPAPSSVKRVSVDATPLSFFPAAPHMQQSASSVGATGSASPTSTRATLPPSSPMSQRQALPPHLQQQQQQQHAYAAAAPPAAYYPSSVYQGYETHSPQGSFDAGLAYGVPGEGYYGAPPPPPQGPPTAHPFAQHAYAHVPPVTQHHYQQPYNPYAEAYLGDGGVEQHQQHQQHAAQWGMY
ncbi:hypothetical protein JCM10207_002292 [Rhodosporidiobolus poonsookiae]